MLTAATVSYGEGKLCDRLRLRSYHQFNIAWTPGLVEPRFQESIQSHADVVAVAGNESAPSSLSCPAGALGPNQIVTPPSWFIRMPGTVLSSPASFWSVGSSERVSLSCYFRFR